jgi:hypothetical protein
VEAIAARDEIALQFMDLAVLLIAYEGAVAIEAHGLHVRGLVDRGQALGRTHLHQVARDLGLAIDHDALAAGQAVQVDAVALPAEQQLDAVVRQPFGAHAGIGAGLLQQVHRDLFEHAGPDAAQHVVGTALLDDDVVHARAVQQLAEKQAGRACADDGDLGTH